MVLKTMVGAGWLLSGKEVVAEREGSEQAPVPPVLFRPLPFDAFSRGDEELHDAPHRRGHHKDASDGARLRGPLDDHLHLSSRWAGVVDERINSGVCVWMGGGVSDVERGLFEVVVEERPPSRASPLPDHDGPALSGGAAELVPESPGTKRKRGGGFFGEEGEGAASQSEPGSGASAGDAAERAGSPSGDDAEGDASLSVDTRGGKKAVAEGASEPAPHGNKDVPAGAAEGKAVWVVDENASPTDVCARWGASSGAGKTSVLPAPEASQGAETPWPS
mmetsp:Transcript_36696/g.85838  ORF Transcript_36696/g.85838 Transcript_36696/m.85838 type:complete len:277 (-) Transcript_36696:11-841(-)